MKKVHLCYFIILLCLILTGCGKETSDAVKADICGVNMDAVLAAEKEITWDNVYDAYYHKYIELVKKYGIGQLVERNGDAEKIWDYGCSYLGGVCVVELLDFNEDGIEDLFLVYSKDWLTGKNTEGYAIPQAGTYGIELWTCIDGKLSQLLEESHVSNYLSFRTDYWDNDCCYVTIYADEAGKPILQFHQEEMDGWYDANFYYENGELYKDYFIKRDDSFTKNGERITQEEWQQELEGYSAILLGAGLSSDDFSADIFAMCYGIDIPDTLEQTRRVVEGLRKKEERHYYVCKETYSQLYMQQIFQMNLQEDMQGGDSSAEYMLYDIDRDEVPELIVRTGNCEAAYRFYVYTVKEGMLKECGEMDGGHSLLYVDGDGGLIRYEAHMDWYYLVRYWLEGTELKSEEITDGYQYANPAEGEYYPNLEDLGYEKYRDVLYHSYGGTPLKIYSYEKEKG